MIINKRELINKIHTIEGLRTDEKSALVQLLISSRNMDSFKSKHLDFYANAQYPLIMKQQSINDSVIKDIRGVIGKDFNDIKTEIASFQKGELIIKDGTMALLCISGKNYKKIKVTHLI